MITQLPVKKGGLDSPVIWLDGGNAFDIYRVVELSKKFGLRPEKVLKRIYLSRAFTCYQMSLLILEKLCGAIERFRSKILIISDLPYLYLKSDIQEREMLKAFMPVFEKLRTLRRIKDILIIITAHDHSFAKRFVPIRDFMISNADVFLETRQRMSATEVRAKSNASGRTRKIVFGAEVSGLVTLDRFDGGL